MALEYDGNRLRISPKGLYISPSVSNDEYFPGNSLDRLPNINIAGNYGISYGVNRTQIFTVAYIYELPFPRIRSNRLLKSVAGGWQISGITTVVTGLPITVYMPDGNSVGLGTNDTINRPNVTGPMTYPGTASQWFNTALLSAPELGHVWQSGPGRPERSGPSELERDALHEPRMGFREANLQFRADAFNVFNHTQFSAIGTTYGQSTLGQVTNVYDPRVLQLGLQLSF